MKGEFLSVYHVAAADATPGWMEHFSSKYIVCGKLVENDAV